MSCLKECYYLMLHCRFLSFALEATKDSPWTDYVFSNYVWILHNTNKPKIPTQNIIF